MTPDIAIMIRSYFNEKGRIQNSVNDWDVDIISQFERTRNEMAVLSTRLMDSVDNIDEKTGKSIKTSRNMVCNPDFIRNGSNGKFMQHQKQAALAESSAPFYCNRSEQQDFRSLEVISLLMYHTILIFP